MNYVTLTHRPIPFKDEFVGSFLIRISFANGYISPKQMLNNAGISIYQSSYESIFTDELKFSEILKELNLSTHLSTLALKKAPPTNQNIFWSESKNVMIPLSLLEINLNKFCPKCLDFLSYWKKNWLLKPYTTCIDHDVKLLSNCPSCNHTLLTNRRSLFECTNCLFDLRNSPTHCPSSDELKINIWFSNKLLAEDNSFIKEFSEIWFLLSEYFSNLRISTDYFNLFNICYIYFDNIDLFISKIKEQVMKNLNYGHPRIQLLPFLKREYKFKVIASTVLSDFENHNTLSSQLIQRELSKSDVSCILGIHFVSLQRRLTTGILYHHKLNSDGKVCFTTEVIEDWLINHSKSIYDINIYNKAPHISDESDIYYDAQEISKIFNANIDTIRKFMKMPNSGTTKKYIGGFSKFCISKEIVLDFNRKYIFLTALAKELDTPATHLRDKLTAFSIQPVIDGYRFPAYYLRDDVKHLTSDIINNITSYKSNRGRKKKGTINIDKNDALLNLKEAAQLLHLTASQVVQLIHHNWLLVDDIEERPYKIPRKNIDALLLKKNDPTFVKLDTVLQALDCSYQQLLKTWVMTNFLNIRYLEYWKSVPKTQFEYVLKIHKEYCTAAEANKCLGMHRTHITNLVTQGLIQAHLFGNHIYSIRLFKRTDIERLLQTGYGKKEKKS